MLASVLVPTTTFSCWARRDEADSALISALPRSATLHSRVAKKV